MQKCYSYCEQYQKMKSCFERRVPPAALDPLTTPNMINPFASQSPPLFLGMYVVYTKQ